MVPSEKIDQILSKYVAIEEKMMEPIGTDEYVRLSKEYAELSTVAEAMKEYRKILEDIVVAKNMLQEPDAVSFAQEELRQLTIRLQAIEDDIRCTLISHDTDDEKSVIMEIRAGAGGDEAALFAASLCRGYIRYAETKGWKIEILAASETSIGGYKEVSISVKGYNAFSRLKYESGVHRVQRIPETETAGRIHTSTATVAVLPEAQEIEITIPESELRLDTMRASGAGGQHVNKTESAVRITHIPTGIMVVSSEKSQHQNRARAMAILTARLLDMRKTEAFEERAATRKGQIGTGGRSERVRTYNFPQGRVTDHRVKFTIYKVFELFEYYLDELIDALQSADQAERLTELDF